MSETATPCGLPTDGWPPTPGSTFHPNQHPRGYRDPEVVAELRQNLDAAGVTRVYPHLCPADHDGSIADWDSVHTARFLDEMGGIEVLPWIGGVYNVSALPDDPGWRDPFVASVRSLVVEHPRIAGVHLNIEPLPCR